MRRLGAALAIALAAAALAPVGARAAFGLNEFDVTLTDAEGAPSLGAGAHPFAFTTSFGLNYDEGTVHPEGWVKDVFFKQMPGLVADATYPTCTTAQFLDVEGGLSACPPATQVGITAVSASLPTSWYTSPVYNLTPPPGAIARLGFTITEAHLIVDVSLNPNPPYNGIAGSRNTSQILEVFGAKTQIWGVPSDTRHDELRGICGITEFTEPPGTGTNFEIEGAGGCEEHEKTPNPKPFLTLPTECGEPLATSYEAFSWEGDFDSGSVLTHDAGGNSESLAECGALGFKPEIEAVPTSRATHSPTGLDLSIGVKDEGLLSAEGRSQSRLEELRLTLPEGMTANPSVAEGLETCSEADLARESADSPPGQGCPEGSKIGTVSVKSPLVEESLDGALYVATPHANLAKNSLIAFYVVVKNPKLGVIVKQATRVEPDPETGRLTGIAEDIPQLPFSSFKLHFREGGRSPLVTPPGCGSFEAKALITPSSGAAPVSVSSPFEISSDCPTGPQPFQPGFEAGSRNNAAGAYSPFSMRLTRRDGDQDLTRFDATLPPGVVAKLAGVTRCPDAQIALAKQKTGAAELRSPSCPANSKIGTIEAGAGVGSQLTYVPGSVYLAGPFGGAPLSAVGVVPAVAGPFDVGTVVTRFALVVDPRTGRVTVDGAHSDPIPHILAGIPLLVRDVQVHADRPEFSTVPTSCDPFAAKASIWGGGANPFSTLDDSPVPREARYQAANCSRLGFKPAISLKLNGGTRRGGHPKLRAVVKPMAGDANMSKAVVRLPRSAFLDQAHIRTICTRVQYAAGAGHGADCPKGSAYGHVRAFTPLLSEPLEGPVYLRSSNHNLPDLVFVLHGLVDFEAVGRIDSKHGGIRTTFTEIPDAPISKVVLKMQGGAKGLIVNSTDLCAQKHRANADLTAQSAKQLTLRPVVGAGCSKKRKRRHARH